MVYAIAYLGERNMRTLLTVIVLSATFFAAFAEWQVIAVDQAGWVGDDPAIAVDSNGKPGIAYSREGYGAKYAQYNGTSWEIEYIYQTSYGNPGWFDIVTDSSDLAHVVFSGSIPGPIYALQNNASDGWTLEYLPENGTCMSIDLDSQEQPCIAILDGDEDNRYLWDHGTGWQSELIEEGNDYYGCISLALDNIDRAHVAYNSAETALEVKYAIRDSTGQWTISTVDSTSSSEPRGISLAIDQQNDPRISYNVAGELRYAAWNGFSWDIETVFAIDTGPMEFGTSMALDSEGCPHIVHCTSASDSLLYSVNPGTGWETSRVCAIDTDGGNPDLALDADNRPHIAFCSGHSERDLMYAYNDATGISSPSEGSASPVVLTVSSNPFSGSLGIDYTLAENISSELLVYDLQGRLVFDLDTETVEDEKHCAYWTPDRSVPSGGYLIVLKTADTVACERVVYLSR